MLDAPDVSTFNVSLSPATVPQQNMATIGQQPTGPLERSQPAGQATTRKHFKRIAERLWSWLLSRREHCALDQMQSSLFAKLPLEVRRMIYQHVLGGRNHFFYSALVFLRWGRYVEKLRRKDQVTKLYMDWCWLSATESVNIPEADICSQWDFILRTEKSLPLLLTCRKM